METKIIYDEHHIGQVADQLVAIMRECSVFTFTGPLGAGKTTLIAQILKNVGVEQVVNSPTFTYLNVYENSHGQIFYHFDLYRLETLKEFLDAGFDEYLYVPHTWTFIEWPAIIMPLLKDRVCSSAIEYNETKREIIIRKTT